MSIPAPSYISDMTCCLLILQIRMVAVLNCKFWLLQRLCLLMKTPLCWCQWIIVKYTVSLIYARLIRYCTSLDWSSPLNTTESSRSFFLWQPTFIPFGLFFFLAFRVRHHQRSLVLLNCSIWCSVIGNTEVKPRPTTMARLVFSGELADFVTVFKLWATWCLVCLHPP